MKKQIEFIENLNICISEKILILLVFLGIKPSAILLILVNQQNPYKGTIKPEELFLPEIKQLLNRLNLCFHLRPDNQPGFPGFVNIFISKKQNILDLLIRSFDAEDHVQTGKCLGFPDTAIQAFLYKIPRLDENIYIKINKSNLCFFTAFVFSQEHFKEELKSASIKWYKAVKKYSPKILEENKQFIKICEFRF